MLIVLRVKKFYSCQIFYEIRIYLSRFFEKYSKYQIVVKMYSVRAKMFHADGQTDRSDEANSRFS
jgi:hypothetical protein